MENLTIIYDEPIPKAQSLIRSLTIILMMKFCFECNLSGKNHLGLYSTTVNLMKIVLLEPNYNNYHY